MLDGEELDFGQVDEPGLKRLARALGRICIAGDVVLLRGPLGAGKTTFTRALGAALGIDPREVRSPTYTVCMTHTEGRVPLVHLDLYRMAEDLGGGVTSPAFSALGLEHDELPPPGAVLVVEWSELWLDPPEGRLVIVLGRDPDEPTRRGIHVRAHGIRARERLAEWTRALASPASGPAHDGR